MGLEDVLSDTKHEPVAPVAATEPAPEPIAAAPEPTPAPVAAEPVVAEPIDETTGMTPKEKAFYSKSKDETRKRQELEREYAVLKAQVEQAAKAQQPTQTTQPEAPKEFWEDPEGAMKAQREEIQRMAVGSRLEVSEMLARREHPDFEEKLAVFTELAKQNPNLAHQMLQNQDPASFVYKIAKNHSDLQQAGSLDGLRAKIEAETRIRIETEYKMKEEAKAAELANIPQSLTGVRSTGVNKPVWSGPPSIDDILH